MNQYQYRPIRFYLIVFGLTWAVCKDNQAAMTWMFLGLCVPAGTAVLTVLLSKSKALQSDLRRKLCLETIVITVAAIGIVLANKEMFFETDHVGRILEINNENTADR